jgi:hypothetical protein
MTVSWFMLHGLVSPAMAQTTSPPVPATAPAPSSPVSPSLADTLSPSARASYDAARLLFGDADYSGALLKFKQAYDEAKDARLLWNMASCEEKLRHYSKASALLTRYLAEAKANLTAQDQLDAYELIHTLAPFTAQLVVTSDAPGVEVTIDGEAAGTTPIAGAISIDQGSRHLVGKKAGYEDAIKEVAVSGGVPVSVALAMVKIVHEGRVLVTAGAHDTISIDGTVVGQQRFDGVVASGGHTLRVTAEQKRPYQSEVLVQDGQTRTVDVTLEDEPHGGLPAWLWVTGSVLVAGGLGVGGYFLFKPTDTPGSPTTIGTAPDGVVTLKQHARMHR